MSNQRGSSSVEIVLLAPAVAAMIWLLIWAGTATQVPGGLQLAVEDAARLASVTRSASAREGVAASLVLDRVGATCAPLVVTTDRDGQLLTVTAVCGVVSPQAEALQVPARTVTVVGRSTVDPFIEERP